MRWEQRNVFDVESERGGGGEVSKRRNRGGGDMDERC